MSAEDIKNEIARLTASINQHKLVATGRTTTQSRSNTYVNPNYKAKAQYIRPATAVFNRLPPKVRPVPGPTQVKEVVLGGVAFQSSGRSLVRKDLPMKPPSSGPAKRLTPRPPPPEYTRRAGHLQPTTRVYKPKSSRGGRGGPSNRNMTLNNTRRPYQSRKTSSKRMKYSDKPCPRFTTTGTCSRGLTCMYQHDPSKIAICWNFLQGNCSNTAETCNLSHDPTPERTPLCLHFLNKGRCTRVNCPFPHVNVGVRQGVCRDFAVLGYCEKGLDCDKQHVRECPDFAEKGSCPTKGCKLPHVIRANRNRKPATMSIQAPVVSESVPAAAAGSAPGTDGYSTSQHASAESAQLGDEYISLTFNESESSEDDSESDEDDDENSDDQDEESEAAAEHDHLSYPPE